MSTPMMIPELVACTYSGSQDCGSKTTKAAGVCYAATPSLASFPSRLPSGMAPCTPARYRHDPYNMATALVWIPTNSPPSPPESVRSPSSSSGSFPIPELKFQTQDPTMLDHSTSTASETASNASAMMMMEPSMFRDVDLAASPYAKEYFPEQELSEKKYKRLYFGQLPFSLSRQKMVTLLKEAVPETELLSCVFEKNCSGMRSGLCFVVVKDNGAAEQLIGLDHKVWFNGENTALVAENAAAIRELQAFGAQRKNQADFSRKGDGLPLKPMTAEFSQRCVVGGARPHERQQKQQRKYNKYGSSWTHGSNPGQVGRYLPGPMMPAW